MLEPERRFYIASNQPTTEVAIRRRPNEDLYVNFAGFSDDGEKGSGGSLRVSAGELDLDGLLGGAVRHDYLPDSQQEPAGVSADGSSGNRGETCEGGRLVFCVAVAGAWRLAQTASEWDSHEINAMRAKLKCSCGCKQDMACKMPP